MSKLTYKFLIGIITVLIVVVSVSLYLNMNFIERYFIYQEKRELNNICSQLLNYDGEDKTQLEDEIKKIEKKEDVVIASVECLDSNEQLNEQITQAFLEKGISLKKYWLWEEDQKDAIKNGQKMRLYKQEKLNYSLLANYITKNNSFIAVVKIIPSIERTLKIVNQVTVLVFGGAIVVMFLLISILVQRIISPLQKIGETAKAISMLDFKTIDLHTRDELELLANNINEMSEKLKKSHEDLKEKNRQMEELLANVSHDLKTPIALIKAYASGIKDGIDDGTFLDIIIVKNQQMEQIVEQLLNRAKIKYHEDEKKQICIDECLHKQMEVFNHQAKERNLIFNSKIEENLTCFANEEAINMIFSNLISNAVKYALGGEIEIKLYKEGTEYLFQMENLVDKNNNIDIKRIWEPFYVSDTSRNKNMSGTGLGLSIVKTTLDKYGYNYECNIKDEIISFIIHIK